MYWDYNKKSYWDKKLVTSDNNAVKQSGIYIGLIMSL